MAVGEGRKGGIEEGMDDKDGQTTRSHEQRVKMYTMKQEYETKNGLYIKRNREENRDIDGQRRKEIRSVKNTHVSCKRSLVGQMV